MISIIIPTYCPVEEVDRKLTICLREILKFTNLTDVELIIVEQGRPVMSSIENSILLRSFPHFHYYHTNEPMGFSGAVNKGVDISSGDHLVIVNNDIEVSQGCIEKLVAAYKKLPDAGMLFPACTDPKNCQETIEAPWSWWSCVCISRKVWNDVGPLDSEKLKFRLHDQDWSIRAFNKGYFVGCYRGATVKHDDMSTYKHMAVDETPERATMVERWGFEHFSDYTTNIGIPIVEIRLP